MKRLTMKRRDKRTAQRKLILRDSSMLPLNVLRIIMKVLSVAAPILTALRETLLGNWINAGVMAFWCMFLLLEFLGFQAIAFAVEGMMRFRYGLPSFEVNNEEMLLDDASLRYCFRPAMRVFQKDRVMVEFNWQDSPRLSYDAERGLVNLSGNAWVFDRVDPDTHLPKGSDREKQHVTLELFDAFEPSLSETLSLKDNKGVIHHG